MRVKSSSWAERRGPGRGRSLSAIKNESTASFTEWAAPHYRLIGGARRRWPRKLVADWRSIKKKTQPSFHPHISFSRRRRRKQPPNESLRRAHPLPDIIQTHQKPSKTHFTPNKTHYNPVTTSKTRKHTVKPSKTQ